MSNIIQFTPGKQISKQEEPAGAPAIHYLSIQYVLEAAQLYAQNREFEKAQELAQAATFVDHLDGTCKLDSEQWLMIMKTL